MMGPMAAAPLLLEGKMLAPAAAAKPAGLDRRGRRPRRATRRREGLGARPPTDGRHRQAVGPQGLQAPRRRPLQPVGLHDLRRRLRHGPRQAPRAPTLPPRRCSRRSTRAPSSTSTPRSASRRAGSPTSLMNPSSSAMIRTALPQQAGAGEGRRRARPSPTQSVQEARRPRRRHDGRRHRHRRRQRRHRGRPHRPRPGGRRQGQGPRGRATSTTA